MYLILRAPDLPADGHEAVGRTEVPVVLRDLVLQHQVTPPGVPGQVADGAVVLMAVVAVVGKDKIWIGFGFQFFEKFLDPGAIVGKETVAESS